MTTTAKRHMVKLNGALFAIMIQMLLYEDDVTAHSIAAETGMHPVTVSRYLREPHRKQTIHIIEWQPDSRGRDATPVWRMGRGPDAKRRAMTGYQRTKLSRQRRAHREMLQLMAGQLKEAA